MTNKRIAFERSDGGVSVIIPAPRYVAELMAAGSTEDEAIQAITFKDVPDDSPKVEVMDVTDLPDRANRNRWRLS